MLFDIIYFWKEFWHNWYGIWFIVGFITGVIDLRHYYKKGNHITAKHILDLIFFSISGIIGLIVYLYVDGSEIVLIKKK